ncbi:E3 SUMO-protein ligase ZNF451-like isoform X1 [Salvelinus fontinalis]|uniref:E3 SUMO-protein ligase ZNF451-like isoform X1 n=2 Tax=Salvelinus fontinalis TaxID=8038 RepID=UPI0024864456|nr:E3 SUMO-protein ligase ZNF451-like isoform X1 [Salvelinus fontinalis]
MRLQPRREPFIRTPYPRNTRRRSTIPFARKRNFIKSMSSPIGANDEDEVEFVSEAPLRPVLECIDLLSDGEDDGSLPTAETIEDEIERQKAQVTSTLDRLARQVAVAKKERAEKCEAFKEKQISQKAHGRQELAFSPNGNAYDAKRCVDMWLKMPGVNTGASWRRRQVPFPTGSSSTHTCPVINCGRVYDNVPLLEGHLKRFDHSPCDPTIYLKGSPTELFACVACGLNFETKEAWKVHQQSKLSSPDEDHDHTQTCQPIVCFACPACYLLFYIRDECLQHMSAKNHFSQSIIMSETKGTALPVPFPRYAKNRLIALCKEVSFSVRCTTCQKGLNSHMEAQAHFNVQCRQGAARAEAEKTVVQVMKQLQVLGQCAVCCKLFLHQGDVERHKELSQHNTEVNCTMEKAILHYSNFYEIQHAKRAAATSRPKQSKGPVTPSQKRDKERGDSVGSPAKRQRRGGALNGSAGPSRSCLIVAWFCECGQRFSEEAMASKHLFAANQIFHQCGVCGKHMGESSITRLHMSRFHGGAHLSNFLFHCRLCKVDMPRHEDILLHVSEAHSGHTYFRERAVSDEEPAPIPYAKPSTSGRPRPSALTDVRTRTTTPTSPPKQDERWICRMCEDIFNSEQAVHKHCRDVSNHSFQRFTCGHCPQKYFKEATVRRHCVNEHSNQIVMRYFCGLCDSMEYDTEGEFQEHYRGLHSKDYYRMGEPEVDRPTEAENYNSSPLATASERHECLCPCMSSEKDKDERKATFTRCMKRLSSEDECSYVCAPCDVQVSSFAQIKTHVHSQHKALGLENTFDVVCGSCQESHKDVPSFHNHYHSQHCPLEPCLSSRDGGESHTGKAAASSAVKTLVAVEIKPEVNEEEFEDVKHAIAMNLDEVRDDTEAHGDESDEEMKRALALSVEEAREPTDFDIEMEEALKRSLLEY